MSVNITKYEYIDLEQLSERVFNVWRGDSDRTDLLGKIKGDYLGASNFGCYPNRGAKDADSMLSHYWLRDIVTFLDEIERGAQ